MIHRQIRVSGRKEALIILDHLYDSDKQSGRNAARSVVTTKHVHAQYDSDIKTVCLTSQSLSTQAELNEHLPLAYRMKPL